MKKIVSLLIILFFINSTFAQSHIEPLNKLNIYLQKGRFFIKGIEIKEGYLYIHDSFRDEYEKVNLKDLGAAIDNKLQSSVLVNCNNDTKCVYKTSIKSKSYVLSFYNKDEAVRKELVVLLNDFISSYDKDYGITFIMPKAVPTTECISGDCQNGKGGYKYPDESYYNGDWKNGKREGSGYLSQKDGTKIICNWLNNESVGVGTIEYMNGDKYKGEIKNELPNGSGTLYIANYNDKQKFSDKNTLNGIFVNGKLNGAGKYYKVVDRAPLAYTYESYDGNWKDGLFDGVGTYKKEVLFKKKESQDFNEIITYVGNWKNGLKDGAGIYFNKTKWLEYSKYDGNWKNNQFDGYGIFAEKYSLSIEKSYVGYWKDGNKNGQGIYNEGNVYEGLWENNLLITGKIYDYKRDLLVEGDKKILDDFRQKQAQKEKQDAAAREYAADQRWKAGQKERDELAERVRINNEAKKDCLCDRCGGSGKITFKAFKTWEISNGTDSYGNAKTIKQTGYVDEEQTCTKCLGSGKCK